MHQLSSPWIWLRTFKIQVRKVTFRTKFKNVLGAHLFVSLSFILDLYLLWRLLSSTHALSRDVARASGHRSKHLAHNPHHHFTVYCVEINLRCPVPPRRLVYIGESFFSPGRLALCHALTEPFQVSPLIRVPTATPAK